MLPLLLIGAALARKPKDAPPPPEPAAPAPAAAPLPRNQHITDISAFTVPEGDWRVGPFSQHYGLLDNAQLGTSLLLFPLGLPNLSAKVTAVEARRVSASLQSGYYLYNLEKREDIPGGKAWLTPVGFTTTWVTEGRFSFHGGYTWQIIRVEGEFTPEQLGDALTRMLGADIGDDLEAALEQSNTLTNVHGRLSLSQFRLGLEWRRNERATWIGYIQASLLMRAMITGGFEDEDTGEEKGIGVYYGKPLQEDIPAALVIARQWSWDHYNLRVGIPLGGNTASTILALPYAVNMYWQF